MSTSRQLSLAAKRRIEKAKACDAIHELLDGKEWEVSTLDLIAEILIDAGYGVRDTEGQS